LLFVPYWNLTIEENTEQQKTIQLFIPLLLQASGCIAPPLA
jgi:hypothetical protein